MSKAKLGTETQKATSEELVRSLVEGKSRFHQLPKWLTAEEAARVRRLALEELTRTKLQHLGNYTCNMEAASHQNCENIIGIAQIPMGIVGPLPILGDHVKEEVFVPLATTEGALIASTNRGCSALRHAGGARVWVEDVGMTRAPVFRTSSIHQTRDFLAWVSTHEDEIRQVGERGSRHLKLLDIKPFTFGTSVWLRFRFSSGDAMGMNMATIACDRIVREVIEPNTDVPCVALSGNYCVDKKPATVNWHEGRGKRLHAEVVLPGELLRDVLKTTARDLAEVQYRKNLLGSVAAGSLGFNAHFANVLAALFIATGQDVAQVVEGSLGITCIEPEGREDLRVSVFLPDAPLAAVGGGTGLDTQSEALSMMGVQLDPQKPGRAVMRLAEIVAATVLAGEVSLLASMASSDLAKAHERLGRAPRTRGSNGTAPF